MTLGRALAEAEPRIRLSESAWLIAAQGLSSLSNFGINLVALVVLEPTEFGAFSVAVLVYRLGLAVTRSLVIEPVLTDENAEIIVGGLPAVTLGWGVLLSLPALAAVPLVEGPLRAVLLALAVFSPLLLVEEAFRQLFVARGEVKRACAIEGVWVVGAVVAVSLLIATDSFGPATGFIAWAGAGAAAAVFGAALAGESGERRLASACIRTIRATLGPLAATTAATRGATQMAVVLVGVVLGLDGLARLRGAQTLVSPATVLVQGARLASFRSSAGIEGQIQRARRIHFNAFIGTILWTVVVVATLPFLDRWFDSSRVSAGAVPFEGLTIAFVIVAASSELTLRFRRDYQHLLRRSVLWMPIPIVLAPVGATLYGPAGAAAGTAIALAFRVILLRWPRSIRSNS